MGLSDLPVFGSEGRCAKAKPSKLDRVKAKDSARKLDEKQLAEWRRKIWARDKGKDRYYGHPVLKTIELQSRQGHCHHIEPRANRAVRYDPRNGILLSMESHLEFEENALRIEDGDTFTVNGKAYWDASKPLKVLETATGISRWI